jgi:hypothetical protein
MKGSLYDGNYSDTEFKEDKPKQDDRRRWDDNIKMDFKLIGWEVIDRIHQAQDRNQWRTVVNTVMNL